MRHHYVQGSLAWPCAPQSGVSGIISPETGNRSFRYLQLQLCTALGSPQSPFPYTASVESHDASQDPKMSSQGPILHLVALRHSMPVAWLSLEFPPRSPTLVELTAMTHSHSQAVKSGPSPAWKGRASEWASAAGFIHGLKDLLGTGWAAGSRVVTPSLKGSLVLAPPWPPFPPGSWALVCREGSHTQLSLSAQQAL